LAKKALGDLGEELVADLLQAQGWEILARRWHCRWGELDLVATDRTWVIFIEVKTRSDRNWDLNGALAITTKKQLKLYQTALEFLGQHPELATLACRFDVALVTNSPNSGLTLATYLESAFTIETRSQL